MRESLAADPMEFTDEQAERLSRFERAAAAPESFDATAALRRVLALADDLPHRYLPLSSAAGQAADIADAIRDAIIRGDL